VAIISFNKFYWKSTALRIISTKMWTVLVTLFFLNFVSINEGAYLPFVLDNVFSNMCIKNRELTGNLSIIIC